MRTLIRSVIVCCAVVLCSHANTYYVSPAGSDSNPGTLMQPFRRIAKGVAAAKAGDTIVLANGRYGRENTGRDPTATTINSPVVINKAGTSNAWITLKAASKWGAVLDCEDTADTPGCDAYITLGRGAAFWKIQDVVLTRGYWTGIFSNAGASYITIQGCKFEYIGQHPNNTVYGETGTGANEDSHDLVYDGNFFHDIGRTASTYSMFNDHGLYLRSKNTTIINNIFYRPISGWAIQTAEGFSGLIANNTFAFPHPTSDGHIVLWGQNGDVTIRNNIFYRPRNSGIAVFEFSLYPGSVCTIDHNILYGAGDMLDNSSPCSVTATTIADPDLANTAQPPFDFHLQPGSPAIGKGVDIPVVLFDIDGTARPPGAYDLGAYQSTKSPNMRITSPVMISREGATQTKTAPKKNR